MVDKGKSILIITYYIPPRPGVASLRLRGLAKYLPEFGWEPVVLTAKLPGPPDPRYEVVETPYPGDVIDIWKKRFGLQPGRGLQEQVGISRPVREGKDSLVRKLARAGVKLLAYPDNQRHWYHHAVRAGTQLLAERRFSAMLSSSGPVTSHLVAAELKKRHQLPWIADLRDLWSQYHYTTFGVLDRLRDRHLEIRTLKPADAAVTVSKPLAHKLGLLHGTLPIHVIANGYDPDEVVVERRLTKKFTITYTGQIYEGRQDPTPLFLSLSHLLAEGRIHSADIEIAFYGPTSTQYWLEALVRRYGLQNVVSLTPIVPRADALMKQRKSQILLLLNWNDPNELGVYTGKVFEYLAARRPILALGGPGGVVAQLLEDTGAGVHVSDEAHLRRLLLEFYGEFQRRGSVSYYGRPEAITKYSHREMARGFARLLDEVAEIRRC